jgi:hypothetical protein
MLSWDAMTRYGYRVTKNGQVLLKSHHNSLILPFSCPEIFVPALRMSPDFQPPLLEFVPINFKIGGQTD